MLYDYQKKAIEFIGANKKTYVALDMGMGKTLTALSARRKFSKKHTLVIAEKNEIVNSKNFHKEMVKHFPEHRYISLRDRELDELPDSSTCVCAINPEGLAKLDAVKMSELFDFVIVDEATLAKTATTARFKKVRTICSLAEHVVLLSGTPMMNGAAELFAPLLIMEHRLIGQGGAKQKKAFEKIFAGGHNRKIRDTGKWFQDFIWWAKGANNVRELRYLLEDKLFVMSKGETNVFKKKERKIVRVKPGATWQMEYREAWDAYFAQVKLTKKTSEILNIAELRDLIENGKVYQVNSKWKVMQVAKDIADGMYGDRRVVVFSMFVETDRILQEELEKRGVSFRTFEEIDAWKKGDEKVLIGRIKAHGKGTNAPEGSAVIMVDMDFVPANNIQAENRIDRPEQKRDMIVNYYMTEKREGMDIDDHVREINQDKAAKIEEFMRPITKEERADMPRRVRVLWAKDPTAWRTMTGLQSVENLLGNY